MNDKVSKNKEKKAVMIAEFSEKVGRAKAMVFTNFTGMTHKQIEDLKKGLRNADAELVATKNTLMKRALDEGLSVKGKAESKEPLPLDASRYTLEGPTATLFTYGDPIVPLKQLQKSIKNIKLPEIKFGIFEGRVITAADVVKLASLPPKEVLIAQFVGGLKAPLYGLHRALNWNLQKLVMTMQAISDKKKATS